MYIEEVILEGFKTYMNRTVISGFDSQFNAITGLNGSGKSNILDAIQFLLGSTSKEMLRLKTGLTELIYKEGFAGIDKASVTIKFRCVDKHVRPSGYESCEELVVTRQITKEKVTKFFINGLSSSLGKVRSLFQSVQLNIQNPHFLVKQGQITKIINLKALELLAMIEETAGTAYYNRAKFQSEKIIDKKDLKLRAINEILSSSIEPQMSKLESDRRRYSAYKDKETLLSTMQQRVSIYQFTLQQNQQKKKSAELAHANTSIRTATTNRNQLAARQQELQTQIKQVQSMKAAHSLKDYYEFKNLLAEKEARKNHIKCRLNSLIEEALGLKESSQTQAITLEQTRKDIEWNEKVAIQLERQKDEKEGLLTELSKAGQKDASELLGKQIAQEESQLKSNRAQLEAMQRKHDLLKLQIQNQGKNANENQETSASMLQSIKDLEEAIRSIQNSPKPTLVNDPELSQMSSALKELESQRRRLLSNCHQLNFYFNDSQLQIDRSKVKGKLFMLFSVHDRIHERALEVGAGGKLFNIVVENQQISKQLIEHEVFGRSVTIIPNNRIQFKQLHTDAVRQASRIAAELDGLAKPAYELIQYDSKLEASIMFAFSSFIVCSSGQIAKRIAFSSNRKLAAKCVTYDGDVYEYGTLTGGQNHYQPVLPQYFQLRKLELSIQVQRKKQSKEQQLYDQYLADMNEYRNQQKELENKISRKDKLKQKFATLSLNVKKRDHQQELKDILSKVAQLQQDLTERQHKLQELQASKQTNTLDRQKKQLQQQKQQFTRKLQDNKKNVSQLSVSLESLKQTIKHSHDAQSVLQRNIYELENDDQTIAKEIAEYQEQFERKKLQKAAYEKQVSLNESHIKILSNELHDVRLTHEKLAKEIELNQELSVGLEREIAERSKSIEAILASNLHIQPDREYEIDSGFNFESAMKQLNTTALEVDKLKKSAKMNIDDHSYQKLSEQYKELIEKRSLLETDKLTLLNNMHELDEKRTKTLEKCFQTVRSGLYQIFNDLLPGATATLHLIDQKDVTKGAQIHVHFNKVRKELSELSGGQRSLLALSFILALLQFKPSPFYILDEIDSALDLSHTENIGSMIAQRFPQSQFIMISLKEGMFQNSNVLYRVQFNEGESRVERQPLRKK